MAVDAARPLVVKIVAKELNLDPAEVGADISMENNELWDSVAHTEIVFALEKQFSIEFTQEETEEMYSLNEILAVLAKRGVA
ncbi:MAG: acyl carrier protein [Parvularculaceae bacterium]